MTPLSYGLRTTASGRTIDSRTYSSTGLPTCLAAAATSSRSGDRKSTRLNSSHANISYAVFCLEKKKELHQPQHIHGPTTDLLRYTIFFFNDTATTEIYTLSLHDALPISAVHRSRA